jgi:hypothetical protein
MKYRFRVLSCIAVLAAMAGAAPAEQISGILIDKLCVTTTGAKGGQDAVAKHKRTCNLTPNCSKAGYGVYTADNKYVALDSAGNTMAMKALQESKKVDDMKVTVTGDLQGDTIKVTDLKLAE